MSKHFYQKRMFLSNQKNDLSAITAEIGDSLTSGWVEISDGDKHIWLFLDLANEQAHRQSMGILRKIGSVLEEMSCAMMHAREQRAAEKSSTARGVKQ